jgi:hypothetical protein
MKRKYPIIHSQHFSDWTLVDVIAGWMGGRRPSGFSVFQMPGIKALSLLIAGDVSSFQPDSLPHLSLLQPHSQCPAFGFKCIRYSLQRYED